MFSPVVKAIQLIHLIIVLFVIIVPFTNSPYFLMLHAIFVPFLWLHWLTNNDTCCLTMLEKYIRGTKTKEEEEECFTCRLINPIFNFKKNNIDSSKMIYILTISMWIITIVRLSLKFKNKEITKLMDLFEIKKK